MIIHCANSMTRVSIGCKITKKCHWSDYRSKDFFML